MSSADGALWKTRSESSSISDSAPLEPDIGRGLSVIVPTYNEAENVEHVISRIRNVLQGYEYELIVVDDDSPDSTWRIVDLLYGDDDRVRVIRRIDERGLGSAIAFGIARSRFEHCAIIDADLQHPPEVLPRLLVHVEDDVDLVIGSRYAEFGRITGWTTARKLVSKGAVAIAKALLPQTRSIADPLSGFFVINRSLLDGERVDPTGYKFLLEALVRCEPESVREVPYAFEDRKRGESKLSPREYLAFLEHVFSLRRAGKP
ncbi:polyprenol monophosphomannose synthase [Natrarchaeobius halalkaliphilus]|uniref:Polyprenol monophosphomannose synthase n=1 Tax=Natrarchaeobius halalkaliphilus TaxID=1679091 RepID=A0A3N6N4C0_9EURY|nr:polyprenol monophosphomannose synthase [Natrarchaeobius halalkaliphilus]RQG93022.1 polyprenol monophosphomannose synthase [Natrarchaeobius halalkaliphilus]